MDKHVNDKERMHIRDLETCLALLDRAAVHAEDGDYNNAYICLHGFAVERLAQMTYRPKGMLSQEYMDQTISLHERERACWQRIEIAARKHGQEAD